MLIVRALIAVGALVKIKHSVQLEYGDGNGGTRTHLFAFASSASLAILALTTQCERGNDAGEDSTNW